MDEGTGSAVSQSALWSTVPIREERHPPASRSDADKHCGRVDDALLSKMPALIEVLLERDYAERDVKKILGENYLRVIREVTGK